MLSEDPSFLQFSSCEVMSTFLLLICTITRNRSNTFEGALAGITISIHFDDFRMRPDTTQSPTVQRPPGRTRQTTAQSQPTSTEWNVQGHTHPDDMKQPVGTAMTTWLRHAEGSG